MKRLATLIIPIFLFISLLSEAQKSSIRDAEEVWSSSADLDVPESVLYDQEREALYVSNINGKPSEKNGKGYIAKMTLEGSIGDRKWISGLNAPKGMALYEDTLYVADVDRVVLIDMKHGNIAAKYGTRQAEFLNDVTVGPEGAVYISDMKNQRIYRLQGGDLKSWKHGKTLDRVNGLHWYKGTLYAGTHNRIIAVDPSDRSITTVVEGTPSVDGLVAGVHNGFLFTDWKGRLFYAQQGQDPITLNDTRDQGRHAADIGFKADKQRVYVPTFFDNRVFAYDLKEE